MGKLDLNFQLGYVIGRYIVETQLPTLSTDMKPGKVIVEVSAEDAARHKVIDSILNATYKLRDSKKEAEAFEHYKNINNELAKKYLKEKLEVIIPYTKPENIEEYRKGVNYALWDCDFSWYEADTDFFKFYGEFEEDEDDYLFSFEMILTLRCNE